MHSRTRYSRVSLLKISLPFQLAVEAGTDREAFAAGPFAKVPGDQANLTGRPVFLVDSNLWLRQAGQRDREAVRVRRRTYEEGELSPGGSQVSDRDCPRSSECFLSAARSRLGSWISDERRALKNQHAGAVLRPPLPFPPLPSVARTLSVSPAL